MYESRPGTPQDSPPGRRIRQREILTTDRLLAARKDRIFQYARLACKIDLSYCPSLEYLEPAILWTLLVAGMDVTAANHPPPSFSRAAMIRCSCFG